MGSAKASAVETVGPALYSLGLQLLTFASQARPDVIKLVRGLDQSGVGKDGANLIILWTCLTTTANNSFYAAEESTLRWLLKSMNGSSPEAETMRRFPLTWAIFECVFQKIPLFSLAKSLADRKFVAVLQQTLKDLAQPIEKPVTSGKRKRNETITYSLDELHSESASLETAAAVFKALAALFDRLHNPTTISGRDKVGSEHIKSLFCTSASDAVTFIAPAFSICKRLLAIGATDTEGCEHWPATIVAIWELHLQAPSDPTDVALYLFAPCAAILSTLVGLCATAQIDLPEKVRGPWANDIQSFLQRNLISPAREAFFSTERLDIMTRALEDSKSSMDQAGLVLYYLILNGPNKVSGKERRRHALEWLKKAFKTIEQSICDREDRNEVLELLLQQAIKYDAVVDVHHLRRICSSYAFADENTNWMVLSSVARCDFSIFQSHGDGSELLQELCDRMANSTSKVIGENRAAMTDAVQSVKNSFAARRDVLSFIQLWYTQLSRAEDAKLNDSPWFSANLKSATKSRQSLVQTTMSTGQLSELIDWIDSQESSHPESVCVVLNAVTEGLDKEAFVDVVGMRIFNLAWKRCKKKPGTELKWRIARRTISWVNADNKSSIWMDIKDSVAKQLKAKHVNTLEALEAFKCCYEVWAQMVPDHDFVNEPAKIISDFSATLSKTMAEAGSLDAMDINSPWLDDADAPFQPEQAKTEYVRWYLAGSSQFLHRVSSNDGSLPQPIDNIISLDSPQEAIWNAIFNNDINLNDSKVSRVVVDKLIEALKYSAAAKNWPSENASNCMQALARIPMDSFNRWQRERIMEVIDSQTINNVNSNSMGLGDWRTILGLSAKILARPTFHEQMTFDTIKLTASVLFSWAKHNCTLPEEVSEMIARFSTLVVAHIHQMLEIMDERSAAYFTSISAFLNSNAEVQPFEILILKSVISEVRMSPHCDGNAQLRELLDDARKKASAVALSVMDKFFQDKNLAGKLDNESQIQLLAVVDMASVLCDFSDDDDTNMLAAKKLEKRTFDNMHNGDLASWQIQKFLRNNLSAAVENARPVQFNGVDALPARLRSSILLEHISSIVKPMNVGEKVQYLRDIIAEYTSGAEADGQGLAIFQVIQHIISA